MFALNFICTGKKKKNNAVISEAYPESEYNPSRDVLDGGGRISMEDLLVPLKDKPGFNKLRKRMDQMKKSEAIEAPLPTVIREKMEREIAYKFSKKDIAKWESIVKKNREAPTIYFNEDTNLGFSTVGAIASEFEPRTEFEKKMASLVNCDEVMEAHRKDGSRLLELNQVWKLYLSFVH
jgi:U3 small nucleolar RNA-associated protein 14